MKNKLIIIVLLSIGQIFSINCRDMQNSPYVVPIDKNTAATLSVIAEKGNTSNRINDFINASKAEID